MIWTFITDDMLNGYGELRADAFGDIENDATVLIDNGQRGVGPRVADFRGKTWHCSATGQSLEPIVPGYALFAVIPARKVAA